MPESAAARLESKVDQLITSVGELRTSHTRLEDAMASDKKITDQYNSFVQQTLTRLQAEVDTERDERKAEVAAVRATLAKLAWVLFSAFLALVGTGLAIVLFPKT